MSPFLSHLFARKTLRFRLFILFTILSALTIAAFTSFYLAQQRQSSIERLTQDGRLVITALKSGIRLPLYAEYREGIATCIAESLDNSAVTAIRVFNHDNILLAEGKGPAVKLGGETISVREEVLIKDLNYTPEALLLGEDYTRSRVIGYIEVTMNMQSLTSQLRNLYRMALILSLAFWGGATLLGYILLRHITAPFQNLLAGIREIESGNLSPEITFSHGDETEQAAIAVLDLATSLRQREEENKRLNDELVRSLRLEIREEKKKLMAKLINTNRMTSLGLLVSSMAHEINNPNGSIRLTNEYLSKMWQAAIPVLDSTRNMVGEFTLCGLPYGQAREEIQSACANIGRCTERIEQVIRDLRNYSLGERLSQESMVMINDVATAAVSILRAHGRREDVSIVTELGEDIPQVKGNPKQLEQVLLNLIMNAAQAYDDKKGEVRVTTSYAADSGEVLVEVSDRGRGIDAEEMPRIFDPFYSTRIDRGGSGLGLYISKFIVEEHGGSIGVDSKPGEGSTFRVSLPIMMTEQDS